MHYNAKQATQVQAIIETGSRFEKKKGFSAALDVGGRDAKNFDFKKFQRQYKCDSTATASAIVTPDGLLDCDVMSRTFWESKTVASFISQRERGSTGYPVLQHRERTRCFLQYVARAAPNI